MAPRSPGPSTPTRSPSRGSPRTTSTSRPSPHSPATFADEEEDGVLGLAFPEISNLHQSPFFTTAKAQGAVKACGVFAFKLDTAGSELYLGGAHPKMYTGGIEYRAVVGTGFWQIGRS
ncbi:hypothetical protein C8Q80DRAFT_1184870 [Daedaleopsis nitida]|nr:hypothetical protein C8Q80DRAFT_1184870 [Daedaleopsis nitida]